MTTFHAQPVNSFTEGFYFDIFEEFQEKAANIQFTETFEIQFIDGETIDACFFNALSINVENLENFLDACETWHEEAKIRVIICVNECGYQFNVKTDTPEQFDLDLYHLDSLEELARHFVEEGLFGEIPEHLRFYIDYEAIARDLSADYTETIICGRHLVYRSS